MEIHRDGYRDKKRKYRQTIAPFAVPYEGVKIHLMISFRYGITRISRKKNKENLCFPCNLCFREFCVIPCLKRKKTGEMRSLSACFFILYPLINIEKPSIKLRNAYRKTPFCSCGPHGGQLRALRFPYAGCTARSYGTKKTILHNRVLPTVSLLYIAEIP